MTILSPQPALTYVVTIAFQSDGITFAQDDFQVEAEDEYDAERLGRMGAQHGAYHDLRVPGFVTIVQVNEVEGGDHGSGQPACDDAGWPWNPTHDCRTCLHLFPLAARGLVCPWRDLSRRRDRVRLAQLRGWEMAHRLRPSSLRGSSDLSHAQAALAERHLSQARQRAPD